MTLRGDFSTDRRLLLLSGLAVCIGICCAGVGWGLLQLISLFVNLFYFQTFSFKSVPLSIDQLGILSIIVPAIGGLLVGLMARFGSEDVRGHGIPEALEVILFGKSIVRPRVAFFKPLSSAIAIGSGGPFGAEGPIIVTGGAFGSLIAQAFHLSAAERKTLLVAGASAGMAAIFASPLAGALLGIEVLLFEWRPRSLIPVTVACMTAAIIRPYLLDNPPIFPVPPHALLGTLDLLKTLPFGLLIGFFAIALSTFLHHSEHAFSRLKFHWMWWPALGGLAIGLGGYFEPSALGVGYPTIDKLLQGGVELWPAARILIVKSVIWTIALASGTAGGVFAPLLMMGCALGAMFSAIIPSSVPGVWPLIGMAATMSGMLRCPLTAIMMAFELTHDTNAILPIFIACLVSYAVTVLAMPRSILTQKIAERGFDVVQEYAVDPLERVQVKEIMSCESAQCSMASNAPTAKVLPQASCRVAAEKMAKLKLTQILVVDPEDSQRILGIVKCTDLLKPRVQAHDEENQRERVL